MFQVPLDLAGASEIDVQIWDGATLLKREERVLPNGAPREVVEHLPLREGQYTAKVFFRRKGLAEVISRTVPLVVGHEERVFAPVP